MNRADIDDLYNDLYDMVFDLALVFETAPQEAHTKRRMLKEVLGEFRRTKTQWLSDRPECERPYHTMKIYADLVAKAAHDLQYVVGTDTEQQIRTKLSRIAAATLVMLDEHYEQYNEVWTYGADRSE